MNKNRHGEVNAYLDTNALIYLYNIEAKERDIQIFIDGVQLHSQVFTDYLKYETKQLWFCSDSYYEFLCHCYKNNCKNDFIEFYDFINLFCKENYGNLPKIICTQNYYKFDTKKFVDDINNKKTVDYKFYVNERVNAELKLFKNLYMPLIASIKEILKNKYLNIELYENADNEMYDLLDKSIKEMLFDYYIKKDSELVPDICVNLPVGIIIEKYKNINNCNYTNVRQMIEKQSEFNIRDCINSFLKNTIKPKGQDYKVTNEEFYNIFCNQTKLYRKLNKENVLYDYIDYLVKKVLLNSHNNSKKIRKNDIIDLSIISSIFMALDEKLDNNVFISFDNTLRSFLKEKQNNILSEINLYDKLELFTISN